MKINSEYELHVKIITKDSTNCCDLADLSPDTPFDFVYVIIETKTGLVPDGWEADWYESPEAALCDFNSQKHAG